LYPHNYLSVILFSENVLFLSGWNMNLQ